MFLHLLKYVSDLGDKAISVARGYDCSPGFSSPNQIRNQASQCHDALHVYGFGGVWGWGVSEKLSAILQSVSLWIDMCDEAELYSCTVMSLILSV